MIHSTEHLHASSVRNQISPGSCTTGTGDGTWVLEERPFCVSSAGTGFAMTTRLLCLLIAALALVRPIGALAAKRAAGKRSSKSSGSSKAGGFGAKAVAAKKAGPTAAQLLTKAIQQYEAIEKMKNQQNTAEAERDYGDGDDAESPETASEPSASVTKWCVALRSTGSAEFSDWVPVALLALAYSSAGEDDPASLVPTALGACVKEVLESGSQSQPSLRKVGRDSLEYAFEPLDSFETHVYEGLQGRSERRGEAAQTLGLEASATASDVKRAHRKLMMELPPDRFVGDEDGKAAAEAQMLEVQEAYAELGGGQGTSDSFYASIGGKARVSFSGALAKDALTPLGKPRPAQELAFEEGGWRVGVAPMTTSVTREFVTRNLMRKES